MSGSAEISVAFGMCGSEFTSMLEAPRAPVVVSTDSPSIGPAECAQLNRKLSTKYAVRNDHRRRTIGHETREPIRRRDGASPVGVRGIQTLHDPKAPHQMS